MRTAGTREERGMSIPSIPLNTGATFAQGPAAGVDYDHEGH